VTRSTALVTGGCGFVGRRFVTKLVQRGYRVTVVDDLSTGLAPDDWPAPVQLRAAVKAHVDFQFLDFRDFSRLPSPEYDLVVHLAAVVGGRLTIEGDPLAVATDLAIDATFFNWVVRQRPLPREVYYFSSSAAYPVALQTAEHNVPLAEEMIEFAGALGVPDMTYGWAKLTGEFLARYAAAQYGLRVAVFRPFSGYGEDQDFSYPFPSIVRRVGRGETPIVVWGSGKQVRDFIHIDDVVEACFASAPHMHPGEPLNLGSGVGISFAELARQAGRIIGNDANVVNDPSKPEGVFARVGDCRRMLQYYSPRVSLADGIRRVYRFQLESGLLETAANA
jgi:UDP-glucose 4-epimerase